jgi:hypothetical protein
MRRKGKEEHACSCACLLACMQTSWGNVCHEMCSWMCVFQVQGFIPLLSLSTFWSFIFFFCLKWRKRNLSCTKPDAHMNNLSLHCFSTLLVTLKFKHQISSHSFASIERVEHKKKMVHTHVCLVIISHGYELTPCILL